MHEARKWRSNIFVTLTYDEAHVPKDGNLNRKHLTDFIKRLRTHADRYPDAVRVSRPGGIRFFAAGEYGEGRQRPHYHAILFNVELPDAYQVAGSDGHELYESPVLKRLWGHGFANFGAVMAASASYVAQYTIKKLGHREEPDADGVVRVAPFGAMSTRPALGSGWLEVFATDLRHGYLVVDGKKCKIPRTYKLKLKDVNPWLAEELEARVQAHRAGNRSDATHPDRLRDAEVIHKRRLELKPRRA